MKKLFFLCQPHQVGVAKATGLAAIAPVLSSYIALLTLKQKMNPALILELGLQ